MKRHRNKQTTHKQTHETTTVQKKNYIKNNAEQQEHTMQKTHTTHIQNHKHQEFKRSIKQTRVNNTKAEKYKQKKHTINNA